MRKIILLISLLTILQKSFAQKDSILARIIFIGDAGEMDGQQKLLIPDAASKIIKDKTTVMFLGDNIYPRGMGLSGSPEETKTQEILRSQFAPMRQAGAPVFFIPGNHDWDRMGPLGLAKIKAQSQFLEEQNDSLLKMLPPDGCPDPIAINISDSLVIIAMDSEWWLFPYDKKNEGADCNCTTTTGVIRALEELMYQNRNKIILLATHHPFQSYGTHGGYYSWQDHVFPLKALNKNLYVPLPVIGSLYPFLRSTFTNPEDLRHPLYQDMIKSVDAVFKQTSNYIHVSGHEHGLQFIKNDKTHQIQIVSGGGAKQNYTIKGKNSLFGKEDQGYVVSDLLPNNKLRFTYYSFENGQYVQVFQYLWDQYKPVTTFTQPKYDSYLSSDSLTGAARPYYNEVNGFHKFLFGKNYRKEWAQEAKLPTLQIDSIQGGLFPEKLGGGFQSTSLRLVNKQNEEYTLRLIEKSVNKVVPEPFSGTFVNDWLDDATSAQHPYSALMVPPIADAIKVPHASPKVGIVVPSNSLGMYNPLYYKKIALLEEREPLGKSDNAEKALKKLQDDNDNTFDAYNFSKARMLDLLLGDWDRHGDQWRFFNQNDKKKDKNYIIVPRDRDMVFNKTEGMVPIIVKHYIILPHVPGFKKDLMDGSNYYFYKSAFLNAHPASQIPYEKWMELAKEVQSNITDSVLETALHQMPKEIYEIRYDEMLSDLKNRRDQLLKAAEKYYRFFNNIVDIHLSDKHESVSINDAKDKDALQVTVRKINKNGILKDTLVNKLYPHDITKEIRLYLGKGDDSVHINNSSSNIKLRIVGGKGSKTYDVIQSKNRIAVYDRNPEKYMGADSNKLSKHIRKDSINTAFQPTNLYNTYLPLITGKYNKDDGVFLGLGVRFTEQRGFRKTPYTSLQQIMLSHSFATKAFNINYRGEWIQAFGNADFTMDANIMAPDNTQNFFGRGNESVFNKVGNFKRYYRARFNLFEFQPAIRWRSLNNSSLSIGPSFQYYHLDKKENDGRFILNTDLIKGYDSSNVLENKSHLGIAIEYQYDGRNNKILPAWGSLVNIKMKWMGGLNGYSKNFAQIEPQVSLYKSFNNKQTFVLADRVGGGVTVGKTAFYQALFLGSEGNLLGYRQYRFAGQHSLYNNLELRLALTDFGNYLFKGQLGILGFYDIGRVWNENENSDKWHNAVGGGIYLAPAKLTVFRFTMGYTPEGWYPAFGMGMRF